MRLTPKYYFLINTETGHPQYGLFSATHTHASYDVFFGVYGNISTQLLGRIGVSVKSCQNLKQVINCFASSAFSRASIIVYDSFFGELNTIPLLSPDSQSKPKEDSHVSGHITAKPDFTSTGLPNLLNINYHYLSDKSDSMGILLEQLGLFNGHKVADRTTFAQKNKTKTNTGMDTAKNKNSGFNHK